MSSLSVPDVPFPRFTDCDSDLLEQEEVEEKNDLAARERERVRQQKVLVPA